MTNTKLLLVEDDPNLGDILQEYLMLKGYQTYLCGNGEEGFNAFNSDNYDMCILDVMLPIMDGFSLAKKIRAINKEVPIIFLTAKSLKEDRVEGFRIGADDYITKPFSMEELQLRIDAIMRRCKQQQQAKEDENRDEFVIGTYVFNHVRQTLTFDDNTTKLTTKEASLLKLLCQQKNKILARNYALKTIWGDDNYFTGRSMDVFITKLRKYLKKDASIEIMNVHGQGYKLIDQGG